MQNVSIKWKVFLFMLGFCVLLLVILWLFQTVFLQSFYTAIKLAEVESQARSLAALVQEGDMDAFEQTVRTRGDLHVVLWDADAGSTQVDGFFPEVSLPGFDDEQKAALYDEVLQSGGAVTRRYGPDEAFATPPQAAPGQGGQSPRPPAAQTGRESEWVLHAQIVAVNGEEKLLLVSAGITPVNATVQTLRIQLAIISVVMVVLAAAIALLLAKRVAKPIEHLSQSAKELGRGNYDADFSATGYKEIGELSQTLTATAKELAKTEALRQDLVANVSHDLRTPLTLITGYAEMMRDIPGETTPENMQVIIDEANRLSSLVVDLLDLSRLQSGTAQLHLQQWDITQSLRDIIGRFQKLSAAEGYAIHLQAEENGVQVCADAARIGQVVYNFLVNAMTYGGEDKAILVRQTVVQQRVKVEVIDHGEGIAPQQLPYVWERYYKVDKTHKRAALGTGLGLSIVKSILQQHPGVQYGVDSIPGQGSSFWFSLPVVG